MPEPNQLSTGFLAVVKGLTRTGLGAVQNRIELFVVEWEQERIRMIETLIWVAALILMGVLAILLVTATVIFLFPQELRIYAAAGFAALYLIGAIVAGFGLRHEVRQESFPESLRQIKKDREWLDSIK